MQGLITFSKLPLVERQLVLRTLTIVAAIRIGLWLLPVKQVRRLSMRLPVAIPLEMPIGRLVWAVRCAGRRVPGASCLTQSLALQYLLSKSGHNSVIRVGVITNVKEGFGAHAWVEFDGKTLLSDDHEIDRYTQMLSLEDKST